MSEEDRRGVLRVVQAVHVFFFISNIFFSWIEEVSGSRSVHSLSLSLSLARALSLRHTQPHMISLPVHSLYPFSRSLRPHSLAA